MRVLIISFSFPPMDRVGGLRAGKMAKYLPRYGWEPLVLTVVPSPGISLSTPVEIPEECIVRTPYLRPSLKQRRTVRSVSASKPGSSSTGWIRRLADSIPSRLRLSVVRMPDRTLGWYPYAVGAGLRLLQKHKVDAIFSSAGPPSSHLIACRLQAVCGAPWVADYRDLWSHNRAERRGMVWQRLEEQFERYVLRRAAQLTTVSDPLAERLRSLHDKPVAVVPNGFDTEDFADACLTPPCEKKNVFTIVYTGKIYPRRQDPALLFQAVHQLSREGFIAPGEVEIHFIGRDLNGVAPLARQCGIETFVFVHPPVPYRESLRQQCRATVLLLLEWTDTSVRGYYSTKVFEYLGAGRPILAVGPRGGVIESLLGECSAGVLVNNSEEMVNVLRNWIDTFRHTGGLPAHANREAIKRYTREAQAGMLADILTKVTKESAR